MAIAGQDLEEVCLLPLPNQSRPLTQFLRTANDDGSNAIIFIGSRGTTT